MSKSTKKRETDTGDIPSRSDILEALQDAGVPLPAAELAERLHVGRREREAFAARIAERVRRGDALQNR